MTPCPPGSPLGWPILAGRVRLQGMLLESIVAPRYPGRQALPAGGPAVTRLAVDQWGPAYAGHPGDAPL